MKYLTKTEKETFNLGKKLASQLRGGEILLLEGDLGAGKTVFTKGLAAGLGIKKIITSPTFVLFKIYQLAAPAFATSYAKASGVKKASAGRRSSQLAAHRRIKKLVHVDCYRLESGKDLLEAGLAEYLGQPETVVVVEWGEKLEPYLQKGYIKLRFKVTKTGREIKTNKL